MNDSLDLFKIRRCTFELHPDPAYPGCAYSEMKMCLAPCFKGCTDEQYAAEVMRVETFFDSRGQSLVREISAARVRRVSHSIARECSLPGRRLRASSDDRANPAEIGPK